MMQESMGAPSASPVVPPPQGTLLEKEHESLGGHMVDFHGWRMPLYYQSTGILAEHRAVRSGAGIFDVSHMGIITINGETAADLLSRRLPLNAKTQRTNACKYTCFLDTDGDIIDDAVLTRLDSRETPGDYLLVVNASMALRIQELLQQHRPKGTQIERWNGRLGIVAVQGPKSREIVEKVLGAEVKPLKFYTSAFFDAKTGAQVPYEKGFSPMAFENRFISRTGYTGELGYELFLPAELITQKWKELIEAGAVPCGLGARDTLRMEKGYLLSGVDFTGHKSPLECGLDRFLSWEHEFVGRAALEKQKKAGGYAVFTGLKVTERGAVPRTGTPILAKGSPITLATSGGLSPTLGHGIALGFLPPEWRTPGQKLEMEIRGKTVPAEVVGLPFV